jgi:hypothetical protein
MPDQRFLDKLVVLAKSEYAARSELLICAWLASLGVFPISKRVEYLREALPAQTFAGIVDAARGFVKEDLGGAGLITSREFFLNARGPEDEKEDDVVPPEFWETLNSVGEAKEDGVNP